MTLPKRSSLHDEALGVIALHAMPGPKFPREESLAMLYHVLAIIPSYRQDCPLTGQDSLSLRNLPAICKEIALII